MIRPELSNLSNHTATTATAADADADADADAIATTNYNTKSAAAERIKQQLVQREIQSAHAQVDERQQFNIDWDAAKQYKSSWHGGQQ